MKISASLFRSIGYQTSSGQISWTGQKGLKEKGGSNPWKIKYWTKFRQYGRKNCTIQICSTTKKKQAANCHLKSHQSPNHQTKLLHAERTNIQNPVVGRKFLQRCNRKMAHFHVSSLSNPSLQLPRVGKGSLHFEAAWEAICTGEGWRPWFPSHMTVLHWHGTLDDGNGSDWETPPRRQWGVYWNLLRINIWRNDQVLKEQPALACFFWAWARFGIRRV